MLYRLPLRQLERLFWALTATTTSPRYCSDNWPYRRRVRAILRRTAGVYLQRLIGGGS